MSLDPRLIRVGIEVNGELRVYTEEMDIRVSGSKLASAQQNECEITISNLTRATRNFILTETSPFNPNRKPKVVTVDIGRRGVLLPGATLVTRPEYVVGSPPGLLIPGNIDLNSRPVVRNADGTISTVRSMSIGTEAGEVLIPTVSADGRLLTDDEAIAEYDRTGQNLGTFNTEANATRYAQRLHAAQEAQYAGGRPASTQPASTGGWLSRVFVGEITQSAPSQPPDIGVTIKALTGNHAKGRVIARTGQQQEALSAIAARVAADLGVVLDFRATDKQIGNYAFSGPALRQVNNLELAGGVDAFLDDTTLVVKDRGTPIPDRTKVLSQESGLVGVPEATERGVKATFMLDHDTVLGGALSLSSLLNPALTGEYTIYKLDFDAASRDTPFYWTAEASRNGYTPPAGST